MNDTDTRLRNDDVDEQPLTPREIHHLRCMLNDDERTNFKTTNRVWSISFAAICKAIISLFYICRGVILRLMK